MKEGILMLLIAIVHPFTGHGQFDYFTQYFDGADTSMESSILIDIDTSASNIWQIGPPQKTIFSSAATIPNALVTDTINFYPSNNTSRFQYTLVPFTTWGVLAIQWTQKLDMDFGSDGGTIEFSTDGGLNWESAFNNPHVYNFYGYDPINVDTLTSGQYGFTGTDTAWKDIWLCYDMSWLSFDDSVMLKHTFLSDSIDNNREGWLIDNMIVHLTIFHTVNEDKKIEYMSVQPNPTTGRVHIETRKYNEFHIIEEIELLDLEGKVAQHWGVSPTKFYIDIGHHPNGIYFLKVKTNKQTETFRIVLQKE